MNPDAPCSSNALQHFLSQDAMVMDVSWQSRFSGDFSLRWGGFTMKKATLPANGSSTKLLLSRCQNCNSLARLGLVV